MQQTTSGAAGNGLPTMIKYLRGAAGHGLGNPPRFFAAGATQLLKPASTTPRSYGRRHRPWHHDHAHATHNERRCGQRPVHHDQVPAWRRGHRSGTTIKYLRRTASAAAENGQGTAIEYLMNQNAGAANNWAKAHIHKNRHNFF
jgi:hypothetical protein